MPIQNPSFLVLLLTLCKICVALDTVALHKYIGYASTNLTDAEFTKIIYLTIRVVVNKKCANIACEDWLITSLYRIYKKS